MKTRKQTQALFLLITIGAVSSMIGQEIEIPEPVPAAKLEAWAAEKASLKAKLAKKLAAEQSAKDAALKALAADKAVEDAKKAVNEAARLLTAKVKEAVQARKEADAAANLAKEAGSEITAEDLAKLMLDEAEQADAPKAETVAEDSTIHTVEPGGSLSKISAIAYKRPGYWRILKLHNKVAPEKLQAGQQIKAPSITWLLSDSKFTAMFPQFTADLMTARKLFMEVEDKLEGSIVKDTITPDAEDQKKIAEAVKLIEKCRSSLVQKKKGVKAVPSAAALQLRTAAQKMALISKGTNRAAAHQNLVHEHLSNSIVYAVLWARNGFK